MELKHMVVESGTPGEDAQATLGEQTTSHYPHGLSLHLDHDSLRHLGIEDHHEMPAAGRKFHIEAMGHIENVEHSVDAEGKTTARHMRLQVTHMGMEHEDKEEPERDHASRMYGKKG